MDRNLTDFATEMENEVQTFCISFINLQLIFQAKNFDNLWAVQARRALLFRILDKWVKKNSKEAIVEKLVIALSVSGFMDVKLRVEKLLEMNL